MPWRPKGFHPLFHNLSHRFARKGLSAIVPGCLAYRWYPALPVRPDGSGYLNLLSVQTSGLYSQAYLQWQYWYPPEAGEDSRQDHWTYWPAPGSWPTIGSARSDRRDYWPGPSIHSRKHWVVHSNRYPRIHQIEFGLFPDHFVATPICQRFASRYWADFPGTGRRRARYSHRQYPSQNNWHPGMKRSPAGDCIPRYRHWRYFCR